MSIYIYIERERDIERERHVMRFAPWPLSNARPRCDDCCCSCWCCCEDRHACTGIVATPHDMTLGM